MKKVKIIALVTLILFAFTFMVSCGGKSSQEGTGSNATSEGSTAVDTSADEVKPSVEITNFDVSKLEGSWVELSDSNRFANVKKTDDGYSWEDNEGTYTAVFKDGALRISVGDGEAEAYYDEKTDQMLVLYGGAETKYKRK